MESEEIKCAINGCISTITSDGDVCNACEYKIEEYLSRLKLIKPNKLMYLVMNLGMFTTIFTEECNKDNYKDLYEGVPGLPASLTKFEFEQSLVNKLLLLDRYNLKIYSGTSAEITECLTQLRKRYFAFSIEQFGKKYKNNLIVSPHFAEDVTTVIESNLTSVELEPTSVFNVKTRKEYTLDESHYYAEHLRSRDYLSCNNSLDKFGRLPLRSDICYKSRIYEKLNKQELGSLSNNSEVYIVTSLELYKLNKIKVSVSEGVLSFIFKDKKYLININKKFNREGDYIDKGIGRRFYRKLPIIKTIE